MAVTPRPSMLGRLRVKAQASDAFGEDTTTLGTSFTGFLELPYIRGTFDGKRDPTRLPANIAEQRIDARSSLDLIGFQRSAPSFETWLHSHGVDLNGDSSVPTSATWGQGLLYRSWLGGEASPSNPAAITYVQGGSTATSIIVTAGHGARFSKGGAISILIGSRYEMGEIKNISTDTLTMKWQFSAVPDTNSVVHGCVTYYLTDGLTAQTYNLELAYEGAEPTNRYGYLGLRPNLTLDLTPGQFAKAMVSCVGAGFVRYDSDDLAAMTLANMNAIPVNDCITIVHEITSSMRHEIITTARSLQPNVQWAPWEVSEAANGIGGYQRIPNEQPVVGSITPYWGEDEIDFEDMWQSQTKVGLHMQIGTAEPGRLCMISAPTGTFWNGGHQDAGGLSAMPVPFVGHDDESVTSPTTDIHQAAFRAHFG